jgi:hypothetical protein
VISVPKADERLTNPSRMFGATVPVAAAATRSAVSARRRREINVYTNEADGLQDRCFVEVNACEVNGSFRPVRVRQQVLAQDESTDRSASE